MTRVIAVANQKGGVGKTVTSINLAYELARSGRRTLLIDLDPQGHCGIGLGYDIEGADNSTYDLLLNRQVNVVDCARLVELDATADRFMFVPANLKLSLAERELERSFSLPNLVLAKKLNAAKASFDEIVLDCPPALSKLTLNAFLASSMIVIPIAVSYFSIQGVRMLAETLRDIFEETGLDYDIRCLITRYRARQTVSREVQAAAREMFGDYCFDTVIRDSVEVEKSVGAQVPLHVFNGSAPVARDYRQLAAEIVLLDEDAADAAESPQGEEGGTAPAVQTPDKIERDDPATVKAVGI